MSKHDDIRQDAEIRTARFAALEEALHDVGVKRRTATFAALTLAAASEEGDAPALARRVTEMTDAIKDDKRAKSITTHQTRAPVAAALVAMNKSAADLGEAKDAAPRKHFGAFSGLRPQAAIVLAVTSRPVPPDLGERITAIIEASPRRWYGARAIPPMPALSLALQDVTPEIALARFEAARNGLEEAGLWGPTATGYTPKIAVFDASPSILANNFRSLKDGRKTDRRLKLLNDERRAILAAAAPDPETLHAALEPPLAAAWERRRKLSSSAGALAACLALAALGKASPDQSVRDLMGIIAAEQAAMMAATMAATTAATSASASSGSC